MQRPEAYHAVEHRLVYPRRAEPYWNVAAERPYVLAGTPGRSGQPVDVVNPFDGSAVGRTWFAGDVEFDAAAEAAQAAAPIMRRLPAYERAAVLSRAARELEQRKDEIARTLAGEAGKPLKDALVETERAAMTFQVAAEEARRLGGELIPMDLAPHGVDRMAILTRVPVGPVAAISPFNFPLNLTAHKIAPAIAAGNPIVLKPATKTPLSAITLADIVVRAGLPPQAISVLPMARTTGDRLVTDERFKLLTFTGSSAVGWDMKARAGKKKVILELGGNAGVIVDESADVEFAARRVAAGGFGYAGQSCISVQRVYVHDAVFAAFSAALVTLAEALKVGDPLDPATDLGPMIDAGEAERVDQWVREAVDAGASVLTGGTRLGGPLYAPTILTDVPSHARVCSEEVFAPVVALARFSSFERALDDVNQSMYGLQAGVFTAGLERSLQAFETLEVGSVLINDVPTWRIDHMPYGGVKDSGLGREGPKYTIEEMTEPRLLVINRRTR
jgi:glyceraldehyde-3-phosphate dehydrogenase (NADP+)